MGQSLSQYYQVPFLGYSEEYTVNPELLQALNVQYLAKQLWVPLQTPEGETVILIDDPNDADKLMEIQHLLNAQTLDIRVGMPEDISRYLGMELLPYEDEQEELDLEKIVEQMKAQEQAVKQIEEDETGGTGDELLDENSSAIVNLVNRLIVDAVTMNASDIHVEPRKGEAAGSVRMRVDGVCAEVLQIPNNRMRSVVARIKILSKLDIAERRKPQDGKISVKMSGKPLELRVATLPTVNGESAVLRVLAAGEPLPFEKLNLAQRNIEMTDRMLAHPHGIILVVGPTGSGKTTTLHAYLGKINKPDIKICTAEDPVEITQDGLQQVQVQPRIGLTFAVALRAFLRCDPDVILIGEMRDHETAHSGIEASLTGHLVFSTLHTNSAPETVIRLLDMGLDPMNFADALVGVLAQRLVRTLCKECKEPYKATDDEVGRLVRYYGEEHFDELGYDRHNITLHRPKGCHRCNGSGYRGRTGVHELMEATDPIKKLIAKKSTVDDLRRQAMAEGMRTIMQDGVWKILKGDTDLIQLLDVTSG
jgi:type II secretory ATPase GspE/PulE/Tfp pilus assembly ATPase PilB-like protein